MRSFKFKLSYFFIIACSLTFSSCRPILPLAPDQVNSITPRAQQPISRIVIPIELDMTEYYKLADKEVPKKFDGGEQSCDGVSFDYHFERSPLKLSARGNAMTIDVLGKYSIEMSYCPKCSDLVTTKPICITPRIPFSCGIGEPLRRMSIQYESVFELTKYYGIRTQTKLKEVRAIDPCEVTVFQYNATEKLVEEVKISLAKLAQEIDQQTKSISFRAEAAKAWQQVNESIPIPGFGYIHLQPIGLGMVQPKIKQERLYSTIILETLPLFNNSYNNDFQKELPELKLYDELPKDDYEVYVDFELNYDSLSRSIQTFVAGKELILKGKKIKIDSCKIAGADLNELIFEINFSGKKSGKLYLRALPRYDPANQTIEMQNIQFDLETKSVLLKTAKWLFSDRILEEIKRTSKQDLKPQINHLKTKLNDSFHYTQSGFLITGIMNELHVEYLYPEKERLLVRVLATGKLKLSN